MAGAGDDEFTGIQNPSDALGILAQVADNDNHATKPRQSSQHLHYGHLDPQVAQRPPFQTPGVPPFLSLPAPQSGDIPYQLCIDGFLTTSKVKELVAR